jgi:hypothetical protein
VTLIITDTIIECADKKLTTAQRERLPYFKKDLLPEPDSGLKPEPEPENPKKTWFRSMGAGNAIKF